MHTKDKDLWKKISGSVNFAIRNLWKESLLRSSEELADEHIEYTLVDEDVKEIRKIFIERVNRKKEKYSEELKTKIELDKRNTELAKVIKFPLMNLKK